MTELISGRLDCDKQDYLLRDSYFCGVPYGIFDLARLHNTLRRIDDRSSGESYLAIDADGVGALEQYVLAKYLMTQQVYRHKVRLITDEMIRRAVTPGIQDDGNSELRGLFTYSQEAEFTRNFVLYDDDALANLCLSNVGSASARIFSRLRERRLFKRVYHEELSKRFSPGPRDLLASPTHDRESFRALESHIASILGTKPVETILHVYNVRPAREATRGNEGQIPVTPGHPHIFEDSSSLFASISKEMSQTYVAVYAPLETPTSAGEREQRKEVQDQVFELIESQTEKGAEQ